jgi:hypothetical protein
LATRVAVVQIHEVLFVVVEEFLHRPSIEYSETWWFDVGNVERRG